MTQSIETLLARARQQLIALMQMRNRIKDRIHYTSVMELYDAATKNGGVVLDQFDDKQLELIGTLASTYLREVV